MATAGWYNDESDLELARWFDGVGWTEHVVVKADWEGGAQGPPPPEVWEPDGSRRRRAVVASAVVVAVLAAGGVALARDDGDDPPERAPTARQSGTSDGLGELGDVSDTGVDVPLPASGDDSAVVATPSTAKIGTSRTTQRTAPPATVRRTETATRSQTNPGPVTEVGGGDKSSVGNSTNTTIVAGYVPPPPTTSTTAAPTTSEPTTSSTPEQTSTVPP